jgi:Zn-dependent peptidase ImmA (M78 family)
MDLSNKASALRKKLGEDASSPIDIFASVQGIEKLTLVFYPLGQNISGACLHADGSHVIAVNSSMSLGRQRFSLAHELYHYYYDEGSPSVICQVAIGKGTELERSADIFASYLLMPQSGLYDKLITIRGKENRKLTVDDIVGLEQLFGVSRQAMLIRLLEEKQLNGKEAEMMKVNVIMSAAKLGYDVSLYKPTSAGNNRTTLGYYIKLADSLFTANAISSGKYEELLLDAFRDDIVYGDDLEIGEQAID